MTRHGAFCCALGLALVAGSAPAAAQEQDCAEIEAAHRALLAGSFAVERDFEVTINDTPRMRERARLSYAGGRLEREILEREVLDDSLVLEEGEEESALAMPFACERLEVRGGGRYLLSSADGSETVLFVLAAERGALQPLVWTSSESVRLLWKKLRIEAVAEYREFTWR